jgi:Na+/H+ antiporter NhaC
VCAPCVEPSTADGKCWHEEDLKVVSVLFELLFVLPPVLSFVLSFAGKNAFLQNFPFFVVDAPMQNVNDP